MSIRSVTFESTDISFDKGRFACWLKIGSETHADDNFIIFAASDTTAIIALFLVNLPLSPILGIYDITDISNYNIYIDSSPLSLDTAYFVEMSWNHSILSNHLYLDNVERSLTLVGYAGTVMTTGIADTLNIGYSDHPSSDFDIRIKNIMISNLDTRNLYALR